MPCGVLSRYQPVRGLCCSYHQDGRNLAFTSTELYGITSQKILFLHSPYCGNHISKSNCNLITEHHKVSLCMYNSFIFPSCCHLLPRCLISYLTLSYDITDQILKGNVHFLFPSVCKISGFRYEGTEICSLLRYDTVYTGNSLPTFRKNQSVSSSRAKKSNNIFS
jgi:hypothetical protein